MNKKIIPIILLLIILCIVGVFYFIKPKENIQKIYLTEKYYVEDKGEFIKIEKTQLEELVNETYILYTYNDYCKFPIPCDSIFEELMETYHINFLSIPFVDFRETSFYPEVKYAPSIIIVQEGKTIDYLDANSDDDIEKYQNVKELKKWLEQYIYLSK